MAVERLLAAIVEEAGGEIRVSYDALLRAHGPTNKYLVMEIVEGGAALAVSLAEEDEVPENVR